MDAGPEKNDTMEIIHVVLGKANPDRMNGVNKVVNQLATRQVMAGRTVSVWGITRDLTHNYPERNFATKLFKAYPGKFRLDTAFTEALPSKKSKAIFHLHGGFNPVFYAVSKELVAAGIPFVFTPHGAYNTVAMQRSMLRKRIYARLFERKILASAGMVHCLGKSEMEGLQAFYAAAKTRLVPYGFENSIVKNSMPDYHRFIIGFCGRLDIYTKGLDLLLQAFLKIKTLHPNAELWIIGDSEERKTLESMINTMQLKGVTMTGSRFGQDKDELLRQVHVFAHPSRNEGLPSAVLEAASLGIPCVVTEATNVGDAIRRHNCGEVIEHPESEALYMAILKMYQRVKTEGWKTISESAREMVSREYNWNKIIGEFDKMYKEAC